MSSIGRNKNKLFTCFRPVAADDVVKPIPTVAPHPLFMHITAGGKEKTVRLNLIPDSADDRCNGGCWGGYGKKKKKKTKNTKKKTNPRRNLSSLLKRVLFDTPLMKRCRRNTETEEKENKMQKIWNSDETPATHVSRPSLQSSLVEPNKTNRLAPPMMTKKKKTEEFYYSPCVCMGLLLVPLIVLIIWGKGLAIIAASICLYLVPGTLKGEEVAELCKERLKQSKKMVIMERLLDRERSPHWRRLKQ